MRGNRAVTLEHAGSLPRLLARRLATSSSSSPTTTTTSSSSPATSSLLHESNPSRSSILSILNGNGGNSSSSSSSSSRFFGTNGGAGLASGDLLGGSRASEDEDEEEEEEDDDNNFGHYARTFGGRYPVGRIPHDVPSASQWEAYGIAGRLISILNQKVEMDDTAMKRRAQEEETRQKAINQAKERARRKLVTALSPIDPEVEFRRKPLQLKRDISVEGEKSVRYEWNTNLIELFRNEREAIAAEMREAGESRRNKTKAARGRASRGAIPLHERLYREKLMRLRPETMAKYAVDKAITQCLLYPEGISYVTLCHQIGRSLRLCEEAAQRYPHVQFLCTTNDEAKKRDERREEDVDDDDDDAVEDEEEHEEAAIRKRNMEEEFKDTPTFGVKRVGNLSLEDQVVDVLVGSAVVKRLVETLRVGDPKHPDRSQPAFRHHYTYSFSPGATPLSSAKEDTSSKSSGRVSRTGIIVPHEAIYRRVSSEFSQDRTLVSIKEGDLIPGSELDPMLCPPQPWSGPSRGGFLPSYHGESRMVRGSSPMQSTALHRADLSEVYSSLDALSSVAWRVNTEVLELAIKGEELKAKMGKVVGKPVDVLMKERARALAHRSKIINELKEVRGERKAVLGRLGEGNAAELAPLDERIDKLSERLRQANRSVEKTQIDISRRISARAACSTAMRLQDADRFWLPYHLDFRGRAYPTPPSLTPVGDDLSRALLLFAEAKPLGERGFFWLKVHLANQMGVNKVSFEERARWVDKNMEHVFRTADVPINPANQSMEHEWWGKADSPMQAYATCVEIAAAVRSGNPKTYRCALPVHQDGSCNGLQHYAALGRDEDGARAVNLVATGTKPADVYTEILKLVVEKVDRQAKEWEDGTLGRLSKQEIEEVAELGKLPVGCSEEFRARMDRYLASELKGKINRKTVKQTVMTSVYGVTNIGARDQILRRLDEGNDESKALASRGGPLMDVVDDRIVPLAASYLAAHTMEAIGTKFSRADAIMKWLQQCASQMGQLGAPVAWITPLGLPVAQPYLAKPAVQYASAMQDVMIVSARGIEAAGGISRMKQRTAFPPNYVHSLDSAHMFMTATRCVSRGIAFSAVHDSYWTHPGDVDAMAAILRETFVELHSRDLLGDLRKQFMARFPQIPFAPPPQRGSLDIAEVLRSPYFFN